MRRNEEYDAGMSPVKFLEIFNDRKGLKSEKARQKRLNDFQRIKDMKSTEGKTVIELLPEEIWQVILDDVELGPEERRNLWHLDPLFRFMMESTHIGENLFPLILKFQVHLFQTATKESDSVNDEALIDFQPHDRPYLHLRRVCKTWRNAVDRVIEEDLLRVLREGNVKSEPNKIVKFQFFFFEHHPDRDIPKLDRAVAFTESNADSLQCFISRSLCIELPLLTFNPDFLNAFPEVKDKISSFLKHSGDKIWYFSLRVTQYQETSDNRLTELYIALVQWLSFMPHLKWLQLRFSCSQKRLGTPLDLQILRDQPPMELKYLERLDFTLDGVSPCQQDEMEAICKTILEACPNLTKLNLSPGVYNVLSSDRPEVFSLTSSSANHKLDMSLIASTMQHLTLHLELDHRVNKMSSLFQFIQQFQALEKLDLNVENVVIDDGLDFLQLPQLKELKLRIAPTFNCDAPLEFFFSLQFLIQCKYLKKLDWNNVMGIREVEKLMEHTEWDWPEPEHMIDFMDGRRDLRDSNVWQVFPYLEHVIVCVIDPYVNGRGYNVKYHEYRNRKLVASRDLACDCDTEEN